MIQVPRDDRSVIGQWWWTVDRWSLGAILGIIAFGVMLTLAASPPAAERIGADSFVFAKRQFFFLPIALMLMLAISLASPRHIRRLALLVFCGSIVLLAATFVIGVEIKGARRWISVPGLSSLQPSEFVKPSLAVISAWLLAQSRAERRAPGYI
ncbi:MAG: FtsW/RodA/SpoVE family cell cycle protein, partial [Reyranellaceae bacterium]